VNPYINILNFFEIIITLIWYCFRTATQCCAGASPDTKDSHRTDRTVQYYIYGNHGDGCNDVDEAASCGVDHLDSGVVCRSPDVGAGPSASQCGVPA
jgi:hypothetical protein